MVVERPHHTPPNTPTSASNSIREDAEEPLRRARIAFEHARGEAKHTKKKNKQGANSSSVFFLGLVIFLAFYIFLGFYGFPLM